MSFIVDFFTGLAKIITGFVKTIVAFLTRLVDEIHTQILVIWHKFKVWVSEIMKDAIGGLFLLIWVTGLILIAPQVITAINNLGITQWIKGVIEWVQTSVAFVAQAIKLREIILVSDILYQVWDEYRKIFEPLNKAISDLSGDLGYITGFVNLFLQNLKTVIGDVCILLGYDEKAIDVIFLEEAIKVTKAIEDNFEYFTKHPERLMHWIEDNCIAPYYKTAGEIQTALYKEVNKVVEDLEKFSENVYKLKTDFDKLVRDLPEEIEDAIKKWWEPLSNKIDLLYSEYINPWRERLDKSDKLFQEYVSANERDKKRIEAETKRIVQTLTQNLIDDPEAGKKDLQDLVCLLTIGIFKSIEHFSKTVKPNTDAISTMAEKIIVRIEVPETLTYEKELPFVVEEKLIPHKSFFVGDY
ncbi:MAG: hypothetical protein PHH73_04800 [Candidatus Rickettsiella isopodorum]|nr:hypothetical protein [Candidatus Rickettsiella isopodorum]